MAVHVSYASRDNMNYVSKITKHMKEIGIRHFTVSLLEAYPSNTKQELLQRERCYIQQIDKEFLLNNNTPIHTPS